MKANLLFLVSLAAVTSTSAYASTTSLEYHENESYGQYRPERNHSTSKTDLVPSNHGVELNRDFTNMI